MLERRKPSFWNFLRKRRPYHYCKRLIQEQAMTISGQLDFTYRNVIGWCCFYLSTILNDYSRYIISWKLCINMRIEDVTHTLDLALETSGCGQVNVAHKPRLLSDNWPSYVSGELAEWLQDKGTKHSRGGPYRLQTQGKIKRWLQTFKNRTLLDN